MILLSARKHFVGALSLFWIASFAATVLPELRRNYRDVQFGRAEADLIASAPGVIFVGLALGLAPPALLAALVALMTRGSPLGSEKNDSKRADDRRRGDARKD